MPYTDPNFMYLNAPGQKKISLIGHSHVEGPNVAPQHALPGSLERILNSGYWGCNAACFNHGQSGDPSRFYGPAWANGSQEGVRERMSALLDPNEGIPLMIGYQLGVNNTNANYANIASTADITTDATTCIRAARNLPKAGQNPLPCLNPGLLGLWYFVVAGSGTFTLTVGANTTAALAYNAGAAAFQTALTGLASVGAGNAIVYLDATTPGTKYWVLFQGTLAGFSAPTLSSTGAGLATQATAGQATANQLWQSYIVPTPYHLPSGMEPGTLMMVAQDNGTTYGAGVDKDGSTTISTAPLTSTSTQWTLNRKVVSGAIADQVWVCKNPQAGTQGWHRTYCEEDYYAAGGGGSNFTPTVRYHFYSGLHLYVATEYSGTGTATNISVRTAEAEAISNLLALNLYGGGNCYKTGSGVDLMFVDTFTPMSSLITSATPAATPATWSSYPGASPPTTCDAHLGPQGNYLVAWIIATAFSNTLIQDGVTTWIKLLQ